MSDAVGGVINLALIIFFVVVIALYMAFNINYQKAFNVKNKIVAIYEENNGKCESKCVNDIAEYERKLGYGKVAMTQKSKGEHCVAGLGYCVRGLETVKNIDENSINSNSNLKYCYFEIRTQVEVEIPVINNLMGLRLFQVTGQTSAIKTIDSRPCQTIAEIAKR